MPCQPFTGHDQRNARRVRRDGVGGHAARRAPTAAPPASAAKNASRGVSTVSARSASRSAISAPSLPACRIPAWPATSAKPVVSRSMSASVLPMVVMHKHVAGTAQLGLHAMHMVEPRDDIAGVRGQFACADEQFRLVELMESGARTGGVVGPQHPQARYRGQSGRPRAAPGPAWRRASRGRSASSAGGPGRSRP